MNTTSTKPPRAGWARAKRKRSCTQYIRRVQHRSLRIIFHQAKFKKCTWKRPSCAYAGRNVRPGCARLRRAYQQRLPRVRAPSARISAAPALGARASGAHISSACPGCARLRRAYQQRLPRVRAPPARISAAPAPGARASGAHISSACPGCARLRRAYQQRLPRVRAPPARMEAARTGASEQYRKRQKVEVSFRSIPTVSAPTQHTHTTLSLRSSF
jgi:hypothetical protein